MSDHPGGLGTLYFKDITRAIAATPAAAYDKLKPIDADLCRFLGGAAQRNPVTIIGDPRKGKSLTALNVIEMALYRGMNVLLGVAPNKILVMKEWYDKLLEHGLYARYGVGGTHGRLRWSMTGCRLYLYSIDAAGDIPKARNFYEESARNGRKVMHVIDEAQQVMKGKGRYGREVAVTEDRANRYLYAPRQMYVVLCSGTLTPAFLKDAGGVSICDLSAPMPRPLLPSESRCFISARNIEEPWGSCSAGMKKTSTDDVAFVGSAKGAVKAWLRRRHPSDGTTLDGPSDDVKAVGMLFFSPTSLINADGGTADWRHMIRRVSHPRMGSNQLLAWRVGRGWAARRPTPAARRPPPAAPRTLDSHRLCHGVRAGVPSADGSERARELLHRHDRRRHRIRRDGRAERQAPPTPSAHA